MTLYVVTWDEITDRGGTDYNYAEIECEDTPQEIYTALKEYGLYDFDIKRATVYRVSKIMDLSKIIVGSKV